MDYLNEVEKDSLKRFNSDIIMKHAVKKVLLSGLYNTGTLEAGKAPVMSNWVFDLTKFHPTQSNEVWGANLRASVAGLTFLESSFKALEEFKEEPVAEKKKNPAR